MANTNKKAPLDKVSEFLKAIKRKNYDSALQLSNDILIYEPNNSIILSYKPVLSQLLEEKKPNQEESNESNASVSEESTDEETDGGTDEETDEGD